MSRPVPSPPVICTIIAKNYLAHARCLAQSFKAHHPHGQMYVLLIDEWRGFFDPAHELFKTVEVKGLRIAQWVGMKARYTLAELCTAVKPFWLEYLLKQQGLNAICYFDPDIYFYHPIDRLWQSVEQSSIVLTPHILGPLSENGRPNEFSILEAGAYNLGFIGIRQSAATTHFLRWWQKRLTRYGRYAPHTHQHYDQRWVDLVPGMYEGVLIDRYPGHNVAYWDLDNRSLAWDQQRYIVNGQPLVFFHFSGYRPHSPDRLSMYQDQVNLVTRPVVRQLCDDYRTRLIEQGYESIRRWPIKVVKPALGIVSILRWHLNLSAWQTEEKKQLILWYRWLTSKLAGMGLEPWLMKLLGRSMIGRIQRWLIPPPVSPITAAPIEPGVCVYGFFERAGSSGEGARRLVRALATIIPKVAWVTLEPAGKEYSVDEELPVPYVGHLSVNVWYVNPDYLEGFLPAVRAAQLRGERNIGFIAWETTEIPEEWRRFQGWEEIWVYSAFIQQVVKGCVEEHVRVEVVGTPLPQGVPASHMRARLGLSPDRFLFLMVFDLASHMERKNPEGLVEAYRQAFGDHPKETQLVIKTINGERYGKDQRKLERMIQSVGGTLLNGVMAQTELRGLIAECDAYVSLHRAEGFGMTLAEAMQFARPMIATNYSGTTDFMTAENSYPIPYRLVRLDHDVGPYQAGQTWAEPDVKAAAEAMRQVVENPQEAARHGQQAKIDIERLYSEHAVAARLRARLANYFVLNDKVD